MEGHPFPTRIKVKISSRLSYPVGAELISSELADVPQAQSIEISFHDKYERLKTRGEAYSIFTVSYSGTCWYDPGWSINVRPVPRALKHEIKQAFTDQFFPRIRDWLKKYADLNSRYGAHSISVIFDERHETPLKLEEYHTPGEAFSN